MALQARRERSRSDETPLGTHAAFRISPGDQSINLPSTFKVGHENKKRTLGTFGFLPISRDTNKPSIPNQTTQRLCLTDTPRLIAKIPLPATTTSRKLPTARSRDPIKGCLLVVAPRHRQNQTYLTLTFHSTSHNISRHQISNYTAPTERNPSTRTPVTQ